MLRLSKNTVGKEEPPEKLGISLSQGIAKPHRPAGKGPQGGLFTSVLPAKSFVEWKEVKKRSWKGRSPKAHWTNPTRRFCFQISTERTHDFSIPGSAALALANASLWEKRWSV